MSAMNHLERDDKRLVRIPVAVATEPKAGICLIEKDRWWCYDKEAKSILFYRPHRSYSHPGAPQCNSQELIARDLQQRLYPWGDIIFLPWVYTRVNPRDY